MQPTQDTFGGICFRWHPNIQFNWYLIGRKHGWVDVSYLHGNLLLPRKWLRCFSTGRPPRFESGTSWTQVRNGETHPRILSRRAWTLSRKTKTKKKTYPVKRPRGWLGLAMEIQWIFERFTLGSWNGGRTKSSWSTMSCYLRRWLGRCIVFLFFFGMGSRWNMLYHHKQHTWPPRKEANNKHITNKTTTEILFAADLFQFTTDKSNSTRPRYVEVLPGVIVLEERTERKSPSLLNGNY